jgi:hypothetical protein
MREQLESAYLHLHVDDVLADISQISDAKYILNYRLPADISKSSLCRIRVLSAHKLNQKTFAEVQGTLAELMAML